MALDERHRQLVRQGSDLFDKKKTLNSLHQEIADMFYVERGDFTVSRTMGAEFAQHLSTSYPTLCRRDLGNSLGAMLRPSEKEWFAVHTMRQDREDNAAKRWLEDKTKVMRRAMYYRDSFFSRATKEADHDYAAFGNNCIQVSLSRRNVSLLYQTWHLKDLAWRTSAEGKVNEVHRKWRPTAWDLNQIFAGRVSPKIAEMVKDERIFNEVEVRHIVRPLEGYDMPGGKSNHKFVSVFVDTTNDFLMEEVKQRTLGYVVSRWQLVSSLVGGSQYAFSPATMIALPDARQIQAQMRTLLEAGEKYVNPPMVAPFEIVRGDAAIYAGAINYYDAEYDEGTGEVLRPIAQNQHGFPFGLEMVKDVREMLREAFFLNKVAMPDFSGAPEKTAFEIGQRVQEYIRQAMPLFEPIEMDYSGGLCEETFDQLFWAGAFGSPHDMPPSLRNAEIQFTFQSPLTETIDAQLGQKLVAAKQLLATAADLDATLPHMLDGPVAYRQALIGIGTPADWIRGEQEMAAIKQSEAQQQAIAQSIDLINKGGMAAKSVGDAAQSANAAGLLQIPGQVGPQTRQ